MELVVGLGSGFGLLRLCCRWLGRCRFAVLGSTQSLFLGAVLSFKLDVELNIVTGIKTDLTIGGLVKLVLGMDMTIENIAFKILFTDMKFANVDYKNVNVDAKQFLVEYKNQVTKLENSGVFARLCSIRSDINSAKAKIVDTIATITPAKVVI